MTAATDLPEAVECECGVPIAPDTEQCEECAAMCPDCSPASACGACLDDYLYSQAKDER